LEELLLVVLPFISALSVQIEDIIEANSLRDNYWVYLNNFVATLNIKKKQLFINKWVNENAFLPWMVWSEQMKTIQINAVDRYMMMILMTKKLFFTKITNFLNCQLFRHPFDKRPWIYCYFFGWDHFYCLVFHQNKFWVGKKYTRFFNFQHSFEKPIYATSTTTTIVSFRSQLFCMQRKKMDIFCTHSKQIIEQKQKKLILMLLRIWGLEQVGAQSKTTTDPLLIEHHSCARRIPLSLSLSLPPSHSPSLSLTLPPSLSILRRRTYAKKRRKSVCERKGERERVYVYVSVSGIEKHLSERGRFEK